MSHDCWFFEDFCCRRVKFPGRASEEKGTVAEATQLATANVQHALTLVLNHGARKQVRMGSLQACLCIAAVVAQLAPDLC